MNRKTLKKQKKQKRRRWKIAGFVFLLFFLAVGAYAFSLYQDVKGTVNKEFHKSITAIDTKATAAKVDDREPLHILLLGVDERENDVGRSDTMIVMTLDPKNEQIQMVSIPRDTRVEIAGDGRVTRINHAYAYGGSDMAVQTVENFLDIDLDYYVRVNMEGLIQLVDSVGGVTVQNDMAFSQGGYDFPVGTIELNGDEALAYTRMRKSDPAGDLGRNERQRQVIQGIIQKGASLNIVTKAGDILETLGPNVATNMKFNDMMKIGLQYRSAKENIETYQMSGDGQLIGGMYLILMSDEEVQKAHNLITGAG